MKKISIAIEYLRRKFQNSIMNTFLFASILLFSISAFSQHNKTFDFNQCNNDDYEKCFKNIPNPEIFDLSSCKDKKKARKLFFDKLKAFVYNNLDKKTLDYFNSNLQKKDSSYSLKFTYYRNNKGEIISDLVGSNLKRANYEAHKKLVYLLSKTKLKKGKYVNTLKNRQDFVTLKLKADTITGRLQLLPYKKKEKRKFKPEDSATVPIYEGCHKLEDKYSEKTFKAEKKCMEFHISNLVSQNFDKEIRNKACIILAKKYGIYDKKIRTIAKFKFNKEGVTTDIETLGLVPEIEDEVTRIVKKIPIAQPGTLKGKPVGVIYRLPVTIKTIER